MSWNFVTGIVATANTQLNSFVRRVYYITYAKDDLRRMFMASFVYTKLSDMDKGAFIASMMSDDRDIPIESMNENLKIIDKGCAVNSIIDYDIHEESQLPRDPREIEDLYEIVTNEITDNEEDYRTLKHFEKYILICDVSDCICTLTNDEESHRRINDILRPKTGGHEQE
jgi:hypothetical protein